MFSFLITILCAVTLLSLSANGLQCYQGQVVTQGGTVQGSMALSECADSSSICHRYDVSATLFGGTVAAQQGSCFPRSTCSLADCNALQNALNSILPSGSVVSSCSSCCCTTDGCNSATASTSNGQCNSATASTSNGQSNSATKPVTLKMWMMVFVALLTFASVYVFI